MGSLQAAGGYFIINTVTVIGTLPFNSVAKSLGNPDNIACGCQDNQPAGLQQNGKPASQVRRVRRVWPEPAIPSSSATATCSRR